MVKVKRYFRQHGSAQTSRWLYQALLSVVLLLSAACSVANPHAVVLNIGGKVVRPESVVSIPSLGTGLEADGKGNVYVFDSVKGKRQMLQVNPAGKMTPLPNPPGDVGRPFILRRRPGTDDIYVSFCKDGPPRTSGFDRLTIFKWSEREGYLRAFPDGLPDIMDCSASWDVLEDGSLVFVMRGTVWRMAGGTTQELVHVSDMNGLDADNHGEILVSTSAWDSERQNPTAYLLNAQGIIRAQYLLQNLLDAKLGPDGATYLLGRPNSRLTSRRIQDDSSAEWISGIERGSGFETGPVAFDEQGNTYLMYGELGFAYALWTPHWWVIKYNTAGLMQEAAENSS